MNKIVFLLSIVSSTLVFSQAQFQPKGSTLLQTVNGDLDNDGIPEKVLVYNTLDSNDMGNIRELQILKKKNNSWVLWEKSRKAILESDAGGMMGDPIGEIKIEKGLLIIIHEGGSSWKWATTDKYRFQNGEFQLIGYTNNAGRAGDYWTTIDMNLSTGKIIYNKEVEDTSNPENGKTENETTTKKGIKINLNNRHLNETRYIMTLPKTKTKVYL